MQINWKLRLQNKATLVSLAGLVIAFVYQVIGMFGVIPTVSEDNVTQLVMMIITVLSAFGVIVDPTTSGINDSSRALNYTEPK